MRRAALAAVLLAAIAVALVVARRGRDDPAAQFADACAASGVDVPAPLQLASYPLPSGTRFTVSSVSAAGAVLASGYAPLSFPEAVQFFRSSYRSRGVSEAEGAGAAAARFRRSGRNGTWKVEELPGCANASLVTLRLRP